MPDVDLPGALRVLSDEPLPTGAEAREVMRAAATELEERAGRICELEAEIAALERARDLAEQAWGTDLAAHVMAAERAAHPALILGPGMRIEPRRRAVLIPAALPEFFAVDTIVRCGPMETTWRVKAISYHGSDGGRSLYRVELEPVDAHAVPLDVPVLRLPFPATDLGWVPTGESPSPVVHVADTDELERLRSAMRAVHSLTLPGYPAENAANVVAEVHGITKDLGWVPATGSEQQEADDEAMHRR